MDLSRVTDLSVASPGWHGWIIAYFYLGGIAAGAYAVFTLAGLFGDEEAVPRDPRRRVPGVPARRRLRPDPGRRPGPARAVLAHADPVGDVPADVQVVVADVGRVVGPLGVRRPSASRRSWASLAEDGWFGLGRWSDLADPAAEGVGRPRRSRSAARPRRSSSGRTRGRSSRRRTSRSGRRPPGSRRCSWPRRARRAWRRSFWSQLWRSGGRPRRGGPPPGVARRLGDRAGTGDARGVRRLARPARRAGVRPLAGRPDPRLRRPRGAAPPARRRGSSPDAGRRSISAAAVLVGGFALRYAVVGIPESLLDPALIRAHRLQSKPAGWSAGSESNTREEAS